MTAEQLTAEQLTADELTADELATLDAEVAVEIMGFCWWIRETAGLGVEVFAPPSYVAEALRRGNTMTRMTKAEAPLLSALPSFSDFSRVPRYSTDIAAAWDMEKEIQRQGLHFAYGLNLSPLICAAMPDNAHAYHLAHASPELRCRAALMTVREALAASAEPNLDSSCLAEAGRCKPHSEAIHDN